ncbi:NACHT domain-containing protein [Micromonospora sp. KC606]|uniref:NACHT domain-containing protein n=1 Tax=Micromonospora sp. KC606 TaxID=2530379 RepID=UPI00104B2382|nr:NACHT domain-containing protein [Micromonospora sp. KC606]TDC83998.1 NACHT domain-containing protein [Micromonospora sp. KC606]
MSQTGPDPGGSASLYQYFLLFLSWLGFGHPNWAPWLFATLVAAGMLLSLAPVLRAAAAAIRYVKGWVERRRDPRRARRRSLFADHLEGQLRRLDEKEEWRDHRFARLEAEVEMEGRQHRLLPRWIHRRRNVLRREKSLSRALQRSDERLVILQGEPGSGKSVALRNAARALATRAMRHPRVDSRIPLYVNLKELRPVDGQLDAYTIQLYVLDQLNRANSRDVEQFLSDEFTRGMHDGTWIFLFDSFDEIPDVLTATELDATVGLYADALYDFLHGMNVSPGVIASREFKGPRRFGWPRFTVQRLTERQKRELIRKADLPPDAEAQVYAALAGADPMVTRLSGNPMLLGLLCEHVRTTGSFPASSHTIFETFVQSRLERDQERIERRYSVNPSDLRAVAEEIAFRLTAEPGVGLIPTRAQVARLLGDSHAVGQPVNPARLDLFLDALEYVKLAQAPEGGGSGSERPFTFTHRRFQEYFATCVVIREPNRVPTETLLLDGRWRETAVAMLQTQDSQAVAAMVSEARRILAHGLENAEPSTHAADASLAEPPEFEWPPNSLYLLDLLETGLAGRPEDIPESLRVTVTTLLLAAWASRRRHYQLWAVQATPLAEASAAEAILEESFASESVLLRGAAYRHVGWLPTVPARLRRHMRLALIDQAAQGRLLLDWPTVRAQLSRLNEPVSELHAARLLRWTPVVAGFLVTLVFVSGALFQGSGERIGWATGWLTAISVVGAFWVLNVGLARGNAARSMPSGSWTTKAAIDTGVRALAVFVGIGIALAARGGPARPAEGNWAWGVVFLVGSFYAVIWPASAHAAVAWCTDARLRSWPFLPLDVLPAAVMAFFRIRWRRQIKGIAGAAAAIAVVPYMLKASLWLETSYPRAAIVVNWAWYLLAAALGILLITNYVIRRRGDRRRLLAASSQANLNAEMLVQLVRELRSDSGLRLLIDLTRRQRIDCTADAVLVFDELLLHAARRKMELSSLPYWRRQRATLRWHPWARPSTGYISERTLDELARLVAERTKLTTTTSQPWLTPNRQRDPDRDETGVTTDRV